VSRGRAAIGIGALLAAACGRAPSPWPAPAPAPASAPLAIDVVYPRDTQWVAAGDSTFVFGNVNDPTATLYVDGVPVPVYPNGAFLAWTAVPREPGDTSAAFELVAVRGADTARARRWVRVPRRPAPLPTDRLAVDTASVAPAGVLWALPGEPLRFAVRATAGARAWVEWPDGSRFPLPPRAAQRLPTGLAADGGPTVAAAGAALYVGSVPAQAPLGRGAVEPARVPAPTDTTAPTDTAGEPPTAPRGTAAARHDSLPRARVVLARDADTIRLDMPLDLWVLDPARPPVVAVLDPPSPAGRDGIVYGRPTAGGTYVWFLHDGQRLAVSGRENGRLRVRLAPNLDAWIDLHEQVPMPEGTPPPRATVGTIRLVPRADRVDVQVGLSEPVPYLVTQDGARMTLTLYSTYAETDWLYYGEANDFVRAAQWRQEPGGIFALGLDLATEPWGYRVRYEGGSLVWTVRAPPPIDPHHPLRDRRIAVDPGHPPAGATGPTRLYEGDANLAIALRLAERLRDRGAHVFLTRTSPTDSVPLYLRPMLADSADAEILVSIHNNALPDGVYPFDRHGTSVFYFHPHSLELARLVHEALLRSLGLRDLGIGRANLALARTTWMPAVLTEGAFVMIPEQEALLRTPEFQDRYAEGVLRGIEAFLRRRARGH
jgi:N-acetylmuramoyl-L-alanine amidase